MPTDSQSVDICSIKGSEKETANMLLRSSQSFHQNSIPAKASYNMALCNSDATVPFSKYLPCCSARLVCLCCWMQQTNKKYSWACSGGMSKASFFHTSSLQHIGAGHSPTAGTIGMWEFPEATVKTDLNLRPPMFSALLLTLEVQEIFHTQPPACWPAPHCWIFCDRGMHCML